MTNLNRILFIILLGAIPLCLVACGKESSQAREWKRLEKRCEEIHVLAETTSGSADPAQVEKYFADIEESLTKLVESGELARKEVQIQNLQLLPSSESAAKSKLVSDYVARELSGFGAEYTYVLDMSDPPSKTIRVSLPVDALQKFEKFLSENDLIYTPPAAQP